MSIALAHDYFTQRGGAERVALLLHQAFPSSRMLTALHNAASTFRELDVQRLVPSFLQGKPLVARDPRIALPLLARAWDRFTPPEADVLLCSSSGWAHAAPTLPGTRKVVYCHNPARWLYQPEDCLSRPQQMLLKPLLKRLREWDQAAAQSCDVYVANSSVVAKRVARTYGIKAHVVHPPVTIDPAGSQQQVPGLAPGYWLTVARGRGYKHTQSLQDAVSGLRGHTLVVVGSKPGRLPKQNNVIHLGPVTDAELRWLYANARALVSMSREDFGLTPIEANAFGTPALLVQDGGFLESMNPGISGDWVPSRDPGEWRDALVHFPHFDPALVAAHARRFSPRAFLDQISALSLPAPVAPASVSLVDEMERA